MLARILFQYAVIVPCAAASAAPPVHSPLWVADTKPNATAPALAFTADGRQVVLVWKSGKASATLSFDAATGRPLVKPSAAKLGLDPPPVQGARFLSPDGGWAYTGGGKFILGVDLTAPPSSPRSVRFGGFDFGLDAPAVALGPNDESAYAIVFAHPRTGNYAVSFRDLRPQAADAPVQLVSGTAPARAAAIHAESGRFAAVIVPRYGDARAARLECWNLAGKPSLTTVPLPVRPASVAISADGNFVAVGRIDGIVTWFSLPAGQPVLDSEPTHPRRNILLSVAFHPGGRFLAGSSTGSRGVPNLFLVELATGNVPFGTDADPFGVYSLAFSPDGKRLATFGGSGALKVWDFDALLPPPAK